MARFGKRLSSFSRSGPPPQAEISDQQYQELEAIYGVVFTKSAREKLKEMCDSYLIWQQPEVDGQTFADAAALFKKDTGCQQIVLSMDTLMHVGIALQVAVDRVDKEIRQPIGSSGPVGFMPSQAFEDWARNLHDWAVEFSLPTSLLGNGDSPAPFTKFFFALNRMMPAPYQTNVASEEALAQRIKRIRRKAGLATGGTNTPR